MSVAQIYKRTEVVGRGKFGIVYKGIHRATKQVYAIKVLSLDTSEDDVKDVQQEIQFLAHLKQVPNVTRYYGSYLNGTKLWIIMDYCAGGSLRTLLKPGKIEERYVGVIVREVLIALQYIHRQNVIHRDIKAANVLISNEGKVQLCDFGVAAQLSSTSLRRNTMAGTPYWMAPEVIMEGTSYDVKADIWSLGITIYEIATGNPPYCDKEAIRAMQLITKSKPPRLDGKQYSPLLKEIIALCLDENAEERLSAEELLRTKFIKFHKSSPTTLLKELISRYLLWREKKSSRESIIMNIEDEIEDSEIEVKWDFDSLSSNEYIVENDINVGDIEGQSEDYFNFDSNNDYDDEDDGFMTGRMDTGTMNNTAHVTYNTNITYNRQQHTVTNAPSTLKANSTLNKAPKSLLHLFEDEAEEEEEVQERIQLPRVPSSLGMSNASTISTTSRVQSPIVEIEIPSMEDIPTEALKNRSRSSTLVHSQMHNQSTSALDTRKTLDPGPQRRPTISNTSMSQPALHRHATTGTAPAPIANSLAPAPILRTTPSPQREKATESFASPAKVSGSPSKSMKARTSPSNQSPLLQPLNSAHKPLKRNHQNLRLQMPTPTSTTFPLLNEEQDENVNQFGVNVSSTPMAMTPLTEKPHGLPSAEPLGNTTASKRKPTVATGQPPTLPFLTRASSNVAPVETSAVRRPTPLALDPLAFTDSDSFEMNQELTRMLAGLNNVLGALEEKLVSLNE